MSQYFLAWHGRLAPKQVEAPTMARTQKPRLPVSASAIGNPLWLGNGTTSDGTKCYRPWRHVVATPPSAPLSNTPRLQCQRYRQPRTPLQMVWSVTVPGATWSRHRRLRRSVIPHGAAVSGNRRYRDRNDANVDSPLQTKSLLVVLFSGL